MDTVEIKIGSQTRRNREVAIALTSLEEGKEVVLCGLEWAISNTIRVAEQVKKKKPEVHQVNHYMHDDEMRKMRFVVTLSMGEPDEKGIGY
jgi:hypothetical protein